MTNFRFIHHKYTNLLMHSLQNTASEDIKVAFSAHTSFLASSPLLILFGYLEMVDAAFLSTEQKKTGHENKPFKLHFTILRQNWNIEHVRRLYYSIWTVYILGSCALYSFILCFLNLNIQSHSDSHNETFIYNKAHLITEPSELTCKRCTCVLPCWHFSRNWPALEKEVKQCKTSFLLLLLPLW